MLLQCFRAVQSYSSLGMYACQLLTCLCLPACPGATQCISTAQQWSVTATLCQLQPPLTCTTQGTRSQKYAPVWATTGNGSLRSYQHSTGAAAPAACCTSDSLLTFVPTGRLLAAASQGRPEAPSRVCRTKGLGHKQWQAFKQRFCHLYNGTYTCKLSRQEC